MENQEVRQALNLFDTTDKWEAFVALSQQVNKLKDIMFQTAANQVTKLFSEVETNADWDFKQPNPNSMEVHFFLKYFGETSICLTFGWEGTIWLRALQHGNDFGLANQLLAEPEFRVIEQCFSRVDTRQSQQWREFLLSERGNFTFGNSSDEHFEPFELAWYAHHQTERFLAQIAAKVAKFQTPEATAALIELNERTRKLEAT